MSQKQQMLMMMAGIAGMFECYGGFDTPRTELPKPHWKETQTESEKEVALEKARVRREARAIKRAKQKEHR